MVDVNGVLAELAAVVEHATSFSSESYAIVIRRDRGVKWWWEKKKAVRKKIMVTFSQTGADTWSAKVTYRSIWYSYPRR